MYYFTDDGTYGYWGEQNILCDTDEWTMAVLTGCGLVAVRRARRGSTCGTRHPAQGHIRSNPSPDRRKPDAPR